MKNFMSIDNGKTMAAMSEREVMDVLQASLYPGATDDSVRMVIAYCQATQLDPMQKPVHIVPMWDGKLRTMRDVIMPGVGLYRTQAARTGEYAGVSEPEYGDDVAETLDGQEIIYPSWCRVTVKRQLSDGTIAEFTAVERWKENYAMKGGKEKSIAPNAMWIKRPYGQLAKCAEAQALRKAFPEVGAQPTADEMEGKTLDERDMGTAERLQEPPKPKENPVYPDEDFTKNFDTWLDLIETGRKTADDIIRMISSRWTLTDEQQSKIRSVKAA